MTFTTNSYNINYLDLRRDLRYSPEFFSPEMVKLDVEDGFAQFDKLIRLRLRLPILELDEPVVVDVPADWFEAFKKRWAPKWVLRRWPVKQLRIKVRTDVILKNYKFIPSKYEPCMVIRTEQGQI